MRLAERPEPGKTMRAFMSFCLAPDNKFTSIFTTLSDYAVDLELVGEEDAVIPFWPNIENCNISHTKVLHSEGVSILTPFIEQ